MTVEIVVHDDTPRLRGLASYEPTVPLRKMGAYLVREMGVMFETEGASRGHPWAPLSPRYAQRKAEEGRSPKILHLRGFLRASFAPTGPDHIEELTGNTLRFGSRDPKASFHDKGTANMPERVLLRPIPRDSETLAGFLREDIDAHANGGAR